MKKTIIILMGSILISVSSLLAINLNNHSNALSHNENGLKTTNNISYEFNFIDSYTQTSKAYSNFQVSIIDAKTQTTIKQCGNFSLNNSNNNNDLATRNSQALIKLDNLPSTGDEIKITATAGIAAKSAFYYTEIYASTTQSDKNGETAYDSVNHAYYLGQVFAHDDVDQRISSAFSADIGQEIYFNTDKGTYVMLYKSYITNGNTNTDNASASDSFAVHKSSTASKVVNYYRETYETLGSFTGIVNSHIQRCVDPLNISASVYRFIGSKKSVFSKDVSIATTAEHQFVDLTTLNNKSLTASVFNGYRLTLKGSTCYSVKEASFNEVDNNVYFNGAQPKS